MGQRKAEAMLITEVTGFELNDERLTPNLLAQRCEATLAELTPQYKKAKGAERAKFASRMKACRVLLRFARTRAGYVAK
jgi:hypothetical protein